MLIESAQVFLVGGSFLRPEDPGLQGALAASHGQPTRPRCMCVVGGVEMYIARYERYVLKCMPGTGDRHHPSCDSYELAPGNSGADGVIGDAVREGPDGLLDVRVRFPLVREPGRCAQAGKSTEPTDLSPSRRNLSLAAFLHLLFERAGLNRWHPAMKGRRSYPTFRRYLMEAAATMRMKGTELRDLLFVPEPYFPERGQEIVARRRRRLARLLRQDDGKLRMLPLVAEVKSVQAATRNRAIWLKHMPDMPLLVEESVWKKLASRFAPELDAKDSGASVRLVIAAVVHARSEQELRADTLTLMLATDTWMPLATGLELGLHEALVGAGRRFLRPLRYDANSWSEFANFLLLDAGDKPVALHVIDPNAVTRDRQAKERAMAADAGAWVWSVDEPLPELPSCVAGAHPPSHA